MQNWRATLIPLLIIPVSIIGTFAVFLPLGFTINTLTLFGFVLAIGIVVDDAIVVVEASLALLESGKRSVKEAVEEAMGQISGPVIAMSLIVAAVFIPVGFIPGIVGRLYLQFAMAIAVSGLISGFVALSLTPALCVMLLKPIKKEEKSVLAGFFTAFNRGFDRFQGLFQSGMRRGLRRTPIALGVLVLLALATVGMFSLKSTGFIPTEDEGRLFITFELPEGASTRRTLTAIQKLMEYLDEQEEVLHYSGVTGLNAVNFATKTSAGTVFTQLQPWDKRTGKGQGAFTVKARMERELATLLPEANVVIIAPAAIPGLGSTAGFTFNLQALDATGSVKDFENNLQAFLAELREDEAIGNAFSFFSASTPALRYNLDREKTAGLGLSIGQVYEALQVYSGSLYVNDFILYNRNFRVIVQADSAFRRSEEDLRRLFVQSPDGSRVPLSSLFEVERIEQAPLITHFNLFRSAAINGESAPGKSSGDAIAALERRAAALLPAGYSYSFSGISREEVAAGSATFFIFTLSILMVFLCLTALYESWSLPFTVLFVLPVGAFGAILTLLLFPSLDNNVYAQIGLLTLVGLTAKNAILIVEYAKALEEKGEGTLRAVLTAFQLRFRPIVMTSLAFIFGVLPLAFATGAGALARQTIGWTVFGGMLAATLLTLVFVPTLYVVIAKGRGSGKAA
nr:efflux RND transporter permease subunit [Nitritalea halalkaliphila]